MFVILETLFELIIPLIMADIIDIGVANKDRNYILIKGGLMIICALLSLGLGLLYAKTAAKAGPNLAMNCSTISKDSRIFV